MNKKLYSNIFEDFIVNFGDLVVAMKDTNHGVSVLDINPYHMEGDVWNHTCNCYVYLRTLSTYMNTSDFVLLALSILFHDVGKPFAVQLNKKSNRCFYNHENASVRVIISKLDIIRNVISKYVDKDKINDIITGLILLVNAHNKYYILKRNGAQDKILGYLNYNPNYYYLFKYLIYADSFGQIRKYSDDLYDDKTINFPIFTNNKNINSYDREIILMCGLPASGKDTVALNLKRMYDKCEILSFDDLRIREYKINNDYDDNLDYNDLYHNAYVFCNENKINLMSLLIENIDRLFFKENINKIIISNTNMTTKVRKKFVNIAKYNLKCDIKCWCILVPPNICIERDKNRDKVIGHDVIHEMLNRFSIPTLSEGFSDIKYGFNF